MIDERYFATLDDYPGDRLKYLPRWASCYERDLRRLVTWWHDRRKGVPTWSCPVPAQPSYERLQSLPRWADAWIRTLRFEVEWQRDQVPPPALPMDRSLSSMQRQFLGAAS